MKRKRKRETAAQRREKQRALEHTRLRYDFALVCRALAQTLAKVEDPIVEEWSRFASRQRERLSESMQILQSLDAKYSKEPDR